MSSNFFDDDILQCIEEISFITESYSKCREELQEMGKVVISLKNEIQEVRELERLQRDSVISSKKLISEQQFTISKLISLKEDIKTCKEELLKRDKKLTALHQEKIDLQNSHANELIEVKNEHNEKYEKMRQQYQNEVEQVKNELSTVLLETSCNNREINNEIERIKAEKDEKINVMVLDYEEQLQKSRACASRLADELRGAADRSAANVAVYQRKIEELERQLSQRPLYAPVNSTRNNIQSLESHNNEYQMQHQVTDNHNYLLTRDNTRAPTPTFKVAKYPYQQSAGSGPYKIARMSDGFKSRQLNIQIKAAEPPAGLRGLAPPKPAPRSVKRKLFSKNTEEYSDQVYSEEE